MRPAGLNPTNRGISIDLHQVHFFGGGKLQEEVKMRRHHVQQLNVVRRKFSPSDSPGEIDHDDFKLSTPANVNG
jgi:hypothetical protein